jgi:hypothetical protein
MNHSNDTCIGEILYNVFEDGRSHVTSFDFTSDVFATILIIFGISMICLGSFVLEPFIAISGAIGGVAIVYGFTGSEYQDDDDLCTKALAFAVVSSFLGAILMVSVARCALWIIVFFSANAVGHQFCVEVLSRREDRNSFLNVSVVPDWLIISGSSVFVSLLIRKYKTWMRILVTSVLGSICLSTGLKFLSNDRDIPEWVFVISTIVASVIGIFLQNRLFSNTNKGTKKIHNTVQS